MSIRKNYNIKTRGWINGKGNEKIVKLNMQEFECIIPRAKLDFIVID